MPYGNTGFTKGLMNQKDPEHQVSRARISSPCQLNSIKVERCS